MFPREWFIVEEISPALLILISFSDFWKFRDNK